MSVQVALRNWGNSQGIRIPKEILGQLNMKSGDLMELEVENDRLYIKKAFRHKSFEERLAEYDGKITTVHYDWGEPQGKEMF